MQLIGWRRVGVLCVLASAVSLAQAAERVTNTLIVQRIVLQPSGQEAFEPASTARPGDLLEYVAKFHNDGSTVAHGLSATLPLPVGTEFIAGSQHPADARASLDGTTFAPMPLKRIVRQADGTAHEELVPARDYRFLRWAATDLAASGDLAVSARVTIATTPKNP